MQMCSRIPSAFSMPNPAAYAFACSFFSRFISSSSSAFVIIPFLSSKLTNASCSKALLMNSSSKVTVSLGSSFSAMIKEH